MVPRACYGGVMGLGSVTREGRLIVARDANTLTERARAAPHR